MQITAAKAALAPLAVSVGVALAIAGCGGTGARSGYRSASPPTTHSAPATAGVPASSSTPAPYGGPIGQSSSTTSIASPPSIGIPQHNGGDRDADNRGGPSDGDGNQ